MSRFLQICNFYPDYLSDFYMARPHLRTAPYDAQMDALLADNFAGAHIFTGPLRGHGFETMLVLANNAYMQRAWLAARGVQIDENAACLQATLQQFAEFKPDIFYTTDVITFQAGFMRSLAPRPPLVVGWRGFPIPAGTDLSCYDLILSSFDRMFSDAKAHGAHHVERFHPGFPDDSSVISEPRNMTSDVVFSGSVTPEHLRRISLINMIAELSRDQLQRFSFEVFTARDKMLSPLVQSMNKGARWGTDMLRALRNARIAINIDVDSFSAQPPNMRLIEATGAGAFLLTSHHPELPKFFAPAAEIETFRTPQELIAKIQYYLSFPERADEIAKRGQERCLRDHAVSQRAAWLAEILTDALARKRAAA